MMRGCLPFACLCAWLAAVGAAPTARAEEPRGASTPATKPTAAAPSTTTATGVVDAPSVSSASSAPDAKLLDAYSPYERATIRDALAKVGRAIEPEPEGKIIEHVDVITLDVIEKRDPAPAFLNWFHWTSKPYVINREILLRVGERFEQHLADETARNMRSIDQLSLVLCIAVKGSAPGRVRLVVITKDVWSLRLNTNFRWAGGRLETLLVQPSEENAFGTHHSVAATFLMDPATFSFGGRYSFPRIGGSQIRFLTDANIILNRESGATEGSFGTFSYGQPLYSTQASSSWGAVIQWRNEMFRRYCTNAGSACDGQLRGFDADATPLEDDAIPHIYRSDILTGQSYVTRSYGTRIKHNVSLGMEVSSRRFRPIDLSPYSPAAASEFLTEILPVSDTRIFPFFEYRTASMRFMRVLDLNTLGLQEDVRVGHEIILKVAPVTTLLYSTRNLLSVFASASYLMPLGDGHAVGFVESSTDIQEDRIPDGSIEAGARVITPRLGFGRLLVDARVLHRYRNYLNRTSSIGGSTRLRGYPTSAFLGKDVVVGNFEFRTRPVEILSCQLGAAVFFDAGDAFDGEKDFRLKQSAGFGVRLLFPQLDRTVLRADWGFPLTRGYRDPDALPGDIVVTFKQAFPAPEIPTRAATYE